VCKNPTFCTQTRGRGHDRPLRGDDIFTIHGEGRDERENVRPEAETRACRRERCEDPAVSKNLISDWERGIKKPAGPTKWLLAIVEKRGLAALVA
jgi:hypothetical protein